MDEQVQELIRRLQDEPLDVVEEDSEKPQIIGEIGSLADGEDSQRFLISVANDPSQPELARVGVFRALEVVEVQDANLRTSIANTVRNAILGSDSDLVRQYAMLAAANYTDQAALCDTVRKIAMDPSVDIDVRFNALAPLRSAGPVAWAVDTAITASRDPDLGPSMVRLLEEWGVGE